MSIIGGGGFLADLKNWRDSMQEELMVVTFEAEVKTPESGVALSWRYQVEVSVLLSFCSVQTERYLMQFVY